MANMEQVQIVKQGRDAVASWRQGHPGEAMDLNAAYLSHTRIPQVDLSGADLRNSDLMGAMLRRSNLSACYLNPCHLYRANLREANLSRALLNGANLRGADLRNADLSYADLDRVILSDADLTGANLTGANLGRVNLTDTNLTDANLTNANLNGANLTRTNLANAVLDGADFYEAALKDVNTSGAKFEDSIFGYTSLQYCDLSAAEGLDQVRHDAPTSIGLDTLFRSSGGIPEVFLRGAGVPEVAAEFQRSIAGSSVNLSNCFISCADQDLAFGQKLQAELQRHGIRSWVFHEGSRGHSLVERHSTSDQEEVERWVRHYDKLVVVCSQAGLDSEAVRNDMTEAGDRQNTQDRWTLFLVSPDGMVLQSRTRPHRAIRREHRIFDLSGQNAETYQQELTSLVEGLAEPLPASADAGDPEA